MADTPIASPGPSGPSIASGTTLRSVRIVPTAIKEPPILFHDPTDLKVKEKSGEHKEEASQESSHETSALRDKELRHICEL